MHLIFYICCCCYLFFSSSSLFHFVFLFSFLNETMKRPQRYDCITYTELEHFFFFFHCRSFTCFFFNCFNFSAQSFIFFFSVIVVFLFYFVLCAMNRFCAWVSVSIINNRIVECLHRRWNDKYFCTYARSHINRKKKKYNI